MPAIPPTRSRSLKSPDQDPIQWKLTNHNQKSIRPYIKESTRIYAQSTLEVAEKFITLLNDQNNRQTKIHEISKDIKHLHESLSFSPKIFLRHVIEHASDMTKLLQLYYEISIQLDILALPIRYILLHIANLDEPLCELFFAHEEVGEAYIQAMDENMLNEFFIEDGRQFLDWNAPMKREKTRRFMYIFSSYSNIMKKDQCLSQLLRLDTTDSVEDLNKHYFRELRKTKELVFMPSKVSTKQADAMTTKSPVFKMMASWFYEFSPDSQLKLTEYALKVYCLNAENKHNVPHISLLVHVFNTACKQLSLEGKDLTRISDIVSTLNDGVIKLFEQDRPEGLVIILTFAQSAFEQMQDTVGYNYASWFEATFVNPTTSILNKRMGTVFMNILQQLIPYEIPSVLQIHGKALHHCTTLANTNIYVSTVKQRLLELGVDSSFRNYPLSLKLPTQSILVAVEDEVSDAVQQFIKRDAIPQSLLTASVFKRQWFFNTFLPKLMSWNGENKQARDELIGALRLAKKIPDALYLDFTQREKKEGNIKKKKVVNAQAKPQSKR